MSFNPIKDHGHLFSSTKSVRKPPGGDCSDIFGTQMSGTVSSSNKRGVEPQVLVLKTDEKIPSGKENVDRKTVSLSEEIPTPTMVTPRVVKDHQKSNIFFHQDVAPAVVSNGSVTPEGVKGQSTNLEAEKCDQVSNLTNGTGDKDPPSSPPQGLSPPTPPTPVVQVMKNALGQAAVSPVQKQGRVPPGGFSTKLW